MTQLAVYPIIPNYGLVFKTNLLSFTRGYVGCIRKAVEGRYLQGALFLTVMLIPSILAQCIVASCFIRLLLSQAWGH